MDTDHYYWLFLDMGTMFTIHFGELGHFGHFWVFLIFATIFHCKLQGSNTVDREKLRNTLISHGNLRICFKYKGKAADY